MKNCSASSAISAVIVVAVCTLAVSVTLAAQTPLELTRPDVPPPIWAEWSAPVDRFVAAYLSDHGQKEAAPVGDAVFARRVYLDIVGLLPPPRELQAFIAAADRSKRPKLVARLLADSSNYAQHWMSFWNDLLRNDEGVNYYSETAARKSITPWLLDALESNLPYDQFVSKRSIRRFHRIPMAFSSA